MVASCSRDRARSSGYGRSVGRAPDGTGDPGRGLRRRSEGRGRGRRRRPVGAGDDGVRPARVPRVRCGRVPVLEAEGVQLWAPPAIPRRVRRARRRRSADLADALDLVVVRARRCRGPARRPGDDDGAPRASAEPAAEICDAARGDDILAVANENSRARWCSRARSRRSSEPRPWRRSRRVRAIRLKVAGAFHSPLMEPAVALSSRPVAASLRDPRIPVAANVTGALV